MRPIVGRLLTSGVVLLLLATRALAQQPTGPMSDCMSMMGWPMMLLVGSFWTLLLILMVLAILLMIKQLRK
jgi:hypothetical protein